MKKLKLRDVETEDLYEWAIQLLTCDDKLLTTNTFLARQLVIEIDRRSLPAIAPKGGIE